MALTTTNLVSYWKLDDNEANTDILDAHSTYDGTLGADTNTKDETGKIGTALNFSSVHANMGASDGLASSDFSISFWVNISSVSGSNRYYLTQGNSTTTDKIMHCVIDSDGYPYLGFYDDDVSTTTTKVSTGWNHLLYTHDTSTKLSSFYLNGAAAGSGTHSNAFTGTSNTYLGGFYSGWGGAGILDEVAIWKGEILSLAEAQDLYNSGDGLAYPFVTDVTKVVSALTLSTTDEYPTLITTVPGGSLSLTASLIAPMPIAPLPSPNTVGTTLINKNYPNVEGLIAGTTKQTGNPNLVAIEGDRSW